MSNKGIRQAIDKILGTDPDMESLQGPIDLAKLATTYESVTGQQVTAKQMQSFILTQDPNQGLMTYRQAKSLANKDESELLDDWHIYHGGDLFFYDNGEFEALQYDDYYEMIA